MLTITAQSCRPEVIDDILSSDKTFKIYRFIIHYAALKYASSAVMAWPSLAGKQFVGNCNVLLGRACTISHNEHMKHKMRFGPGC